MSGRLEYRGVRVRPHPSMDGKKCMEKHGREWWVSYLVYSLMLTEFASMIKSLKVVDRE